MQVKFLNLVLKRLLSDFSALLKVTSPLAKTLPASVNALLQDFGEASQASLDCPSRLLILHRDGNIESISLTEERYFDPLEESSMMFCLGLRN